MKRGTPHHPKTLALAAALGLERWGAIGILESLWHFGATYARRGDVGRHGNAAISAAIGWAGDPDRLVEALTVNGWLDACECHRLRVHDWHDHADQAVHKAKEVQAAGFLECYPPRSSGKPPEVVRKPDSGRPEGINPPPATATAPAEAPAPAVRDGGGRGGDPKAANPLVDRDALVAEGYRLIRIIAALEGLDPTEVLRKASDWNGHGYVALDAMPDNRLAQTVAKLHSWARKLKGEPEPGPPARAAPVNERANERLRGMTALIRGGLREGRELGGGDAGAGGDVPGPGPAGGGPGDAGRRLPPGAGGAER